MIMIACVWLFCISGLVTINVCLIMIISAEFYVDDSVLSIKVEVL